MIAEIVTRIVEQLETAIAESDTEEEIAVWPGMLFNPSTTAIDVYPDEPFRDAPTGGMGDVNGGYRFLVRARVTLSDIDSSQLILLELMDDDSDLSVAHAVGDDPTLNGLASDVFVDDPSGFRPFKAPGEEATMVGVTWPVLVLAAQS